MSGLKGQTRLPRTPPRQRRNAQWFAGNADQMFGGALKLVDGVLVLSIAVDQPLDQDDDGLSFVLHANSGLIVDGGALRVAPGDSLVLADGILELLIAPGQPLAQDANGLQIILGDGLDVDVQTLIITFSDGIAVDASGVRVRLANPAGLEFDEGDLRVRLTEFGGIVMDGSGLSVDDSLFVSQEQWDVDMTELHSRRWMGA